MSTFQYKCFINDKSLIILTTYWKKITLCICRVSSLDSAYAYTIYMVMNFGFNLPSYGFIRQVQSQQLMHGSLCIMNFHNNRAA